MCEHWLCTHSPHHTGSWASVSLIHKMQTTRLALPAALDWVWSREVGKGLVASHIAVVPQSQAHRGTPQAEGWGRKAQCPEDPQPSTRSVPCRHHHRRVLGGDHSLPPSLGRHTTSSASRPLHWLVAPCLQHPTSFLVLPPPPGLSSSISSSTKPSLTGSSPIPAPLLGQRPTFRCATGPRHELYRPVCFSASPFRP